MFSKKLPSVKVQGTKSDKRDVVAGLVQFWCSITFGTVEAIESTSISLFESTIFGSVSLVTPSK